MTTATTIKEKESSTPVVAISGTINDLKTLQSGKRYYTNTLGVLYPSNEYAGRGLYSYTFDVATQTYILADAYVGLATSSSTLFIET